MFGDIVSSLAQAPQGLGVDGAGRCGFGGLWTLPVGSEELVDAGVLYVLHC